MADSTGTQPGEPMPPGTAGGDEARMFHQIISRIGRLPEGVRLVKFRFGEDSDGAPAVWITFVAQDDLKPSKEKIADLQRVTNEVRSEILRSGSERWAYVEVATE